MELKIRRLYRTILIGFFICMLFFTILSRIIDARETPKVRTAYVGQGAVTKTVEGSGTVEAAETIGISLEKGLKIGKTLSGTGTAVKEGDILFYYTLDSLEERQRELDREIRKAELAIEEERLGAQTFEGMSEAEAAAQSLVMAQKALERQNEKAAKAEQDYWDNLTSLKEYYDKRLELSEEELLNQSYNDYDQSKTDYETAKLDRDTQMREVRRKIKDAEKKIERLEKKEELSESEEETLEELKEDLERYEEDLDSISESWDWKLDRARESMNDKGDIYDRAGREADSARLALKENYESAIKQEEQALETAGDQKEQAEWAVESAAAELEQDRRSDNAKALTREQAVRLSELRNEARQLELENLKEERKRLEELSAGGGAVLAPCAGTVAVTETEEGKELSGSERFLLATGELKFHGTFDREEEGSLRPGDGVTIQMEGEERTVTADVDQVDLITSAESGSFISLLEAGDAALGQKGTFESKRKSSVYGQVIPSSALRKDTNGYYCLVLRKQKTILGEENKAARVDLQLLLNGDTEAAVEGAFSPEEPVITGSDRVFGEGDRVRPAAE